MAVRWRKRSLLDLDRLQQWLLTLERSEPELTINRIRASGERLGRLGDIGRPGARAGTREFPVRGAPYLLVYRMDGDDVEILAVYHMAQKR